MLALSSFETLQMTMMQVRLKSIIGYFEDREWRHYRHYDNCLAWNIKVYNGDESGHTGEYKDLDKAWDPLWDYFMKDNHDFFWQCCENGLDFVGEENQRQWDWFEGLNEPLGSTQNKIGQAGRSGGWMVLEEFCHENPDDAIEEARSMIKYNDDYELWQLQEQIIYLNLLRLACESLDKFDASEQWNYECNYRRMTLQEEWEQGQIDIIDDMDEDELHDLLREHPDLRHAMFVAMLFN